MGTIWKPGELEQFINKAHEFDAKVLIDAAQSIAHHKIDIQALNPDFLAFSGHKMFGPTGIGILYIKKELHDTVQPYQVGGSMIFEASYYQATWTQSPHKFEAGTPPIAAAIGLGAAIDYIQQHIDFNELEAHETHLSNLLIDGLTSINDITIVGKKGSHLVSFAVHNLHPHDLASLLGNQGVAIRAGHHCAQPLVTQLGFQSLLRVSVDVYNTEQDIKTFLQKLNNAIHLLRNTIGTL